MKGKDRSCSILYKYGYVGFDGLLITMISLMSSFGPVVALAALGTTLQNTVAAGTRVLAIIDEEPEILDITGKKDVEFNRADIKKVSFAYEGENVLNNVCLTIPKGRIVGIMGKSGCGKSTLLKLLMRFWKIKDGEICLSKENIEEINTRNLRSIESYMTQEAVILKSLKQEASKKTILLVSHRESTLRITDDNLVMEDGRIS